MASSDYDRSTTATSLEGLPDPIREAIVAHAQTRMITLQPDAHAFVTHSRRLRKAGAPRPDDRQLATTTPST
jgi:hypothetical protein